ncbi:MAG: helix-turn-helix domain-containing protein [Candidatus Pacebacteria bacterium]|nr:helix-turn-helix domain-containing protein [Candidatus Paceibacterota bacterium]
MEENGTSFISLAEAAEITNYSQDYISLLCRQGKLKAQKLGRNWVTTREWVEKYVDGTSGKGETLIPVRIIEKTEIEEPITEQVIKNISPMQRALELAVFCFVCLLWSMNIFYFSNIMAANGDNVDMYAPVYQPNPQGKVAGASDIKDKDDLGEVVVPVPEIISLNNTEDLFILEEVEAEMGIYLSEDVEIVESYGNYIIFRYKENPEEKFLYVR